jgi:hypothetical protein
LKSIPIKFENDLDYFNRNNLKVPSLHLPSNIRSLISTAWLIIKRVLLSGYANAKIFKCNNEKCPRPVSYISGGSSKENSFPCQRPNCSGHYELLRHVSFVDCPGHDILMATMLSGAAVMDAALLLIGKTICNAKTKIRPVSK